MMIHVNGLGLLKEHFKNLSLEVHEDATVGDVVLLLNKNYNLKLFNDSPLNDGALPYAILMNGSSIFQLQGLSTRLKEGDRLAFLVMIDGG